MYNEKGERKNSIVVDGMTYVLSPEVALKEQSDKHSAQIGEVNANIKARDEKIAQLEKQLQIAKATAEYYKKVALTTRTGDEDEEMTFKVEMTFVDPPFRGDPGHKEKETETFKTFEEVIRFMDKRIYDQIDKHSTHTFSYCDVEITAFFMGQAYGKSIEVEEDSFRLELEVEADCRIKTRDWESIIVHGYDIKTKER